MAEIKTVQVNQLARYCRTEIRKIINFSSVAGKVDGVDSYSPSKAAILACTRGLATEFGPSGINLNIFVRVL